MTLTLIILFTVVVDVAVRLAKKMHLNNLDKEAQDELASLLPQVKPTLFSKRNSFGNSLSFRGLDFQKVKVKPPAEIVAKVTPEALKTVLEAGLERFLNHVKKQLPPDAQFEYEVIWTDS